MTLTPREKAKELVEKFEDFECALICMDEMIKFNGDLWLTGKINQKDYQHQNGYLFEVKQEIEKL